MNLTLLRVLLIPPVLLLMACSEGRSEDNQSKDEPETGASTATVPDSEETEPTPSPEELTVLGKVGDTEITAKQLVRRIVDFRAADAQGQEDDPAIVPFQYLQDWIFAEIIRNEIQSLGITVDDAAVEAELARRFRPETTDEREVVQDNANGEYQAVYQAFLVSTGVADSEYRKGVLEELRESAVSQHLAEGIQTTQEQMEIRWIQLPPDTQETGSDGVSLSEIKERLRYGSFETVARDVSLATEYADSSGYVGWVPRGAFPELDPLLFGNEQLGQVPLEPGFASGPYYFGDGVFFVEILNSPEELQLDDKMMMKLAAELLTAWKNERLFQGTENDSVEITFNKSIYDWVLEQVLAVQEDTQ